MDSRYKPTPHDNLLQRASGFLPAAESIPNNRYFDEAARSLIMITTILERRRFPTTQIISILKKILSGVHGLQLIEFCHLVSGLVARLLELAEKDAELCKVMLSSDRVIFRRLARTKKPSAEYCTRLSSETDDLRSALKSLTRAADSKLSASCDLTADICASTPPMS
jgi:hypothetical protein